MLWVIARQTRLRFRSPSRFESPFARVFCRFAGQAFLSGSRISEAGPVFSSPSTAAKSGGRG
ncbi:hypothetical protein EYF80_039277 [Liparis tanakae]|uniref:Uncharacterized protein n=1 Tax=Liparis tanakae TaxID=230148 RepID=A0A4Z2GAI4_9TELE|nr:hypothetical protein EYF80_039277 [Liparis tanakae]